jgi:CRP-like cAMP-binding protein|uniref:Cyclic nucleotide-binding domain-containing protein n=1 Tax=Phaeodactylum tricornutum TaxID=2850 RepID=A0A8J9SQF1_PHATR
MAKRKIGSGRACQALAAAFLVSTPAAAAFAPASLCITASPCRFTSTRSLSSYPTDEGAAESQANDKLSRLKDMLQQTSSEDYHGVRENSPIANGDLKVSSAMGEDLVDSMPELSSQGLYQIFSQKQHNALLEANPDKLIVVKFKASYCRACAALDPKFLMVRNDEKLAHLPIVWAEFTATLDTKGFFRRLGVLSLPTVQFYDGDAGLVENFPCGPANFPKLQQKLAQFLNRRVDPDSFQLKPRNPEDGTPTIPRRSRDIRIGDELIMQEHVDFLRNDLSFFQALTDDEFVTMISKARLETFLPGDVIIRQGLPGKTFYVLKSGAVEMYIRSKFDDPISTPAWYLGAVVNQLGKFDYFGERALSTGEPYRASVRVLEKCRCFAFSVEDIPDSSILSLKRRATRSMIAKLTERYELPEDYYKPTYVSQEKQKDENILELLVRFKQIRQAAKCLEYVLKAEPLFGDEGEIVRRSLLASKLTPSQRQDFIDVFNIADNKGSGKISILELRRFMQGARKKSTNDELLEMIHKANPSITDKTLERGISLDEFLGVMAEAEFYYLFTDIFQDLDPTGTGYVRAGDLDEVLDGVRDLISNDRKSLIDVEDQEMQVDYEQFAKMLLGAAL